MDGRKKMITRLMYWLFTTGKHCRHCCLWCRFYEVCIEDREEGKEREELQIRRRERKPRGVV